MGRSSDFKFWEEKLPFDRRSCDDEDGFGVERRGEDQVGVYSPRLWTRAPANFRQETSTLLPQNHHYSCPSPTSRLRAIIDGRRELMEMIKNLPESSYELSLKDIVDDQQNAEDEQEKEAALAEEKKVKHKRENRIAQRTKHSTRGQICRTESMESEVFLLKMFLPVSLSSKKKAKVRKQSKVRAGQSSERPEKAANRDWWKVIFLAIKDNQNKTNIKRTTSDTSSNRTSEKKRISRGRSQRGCLF